jgi:hypothetical protein
MPEALEVLDGYGRDGSPSAGVEQEGIAGRDIIEAVEGIGAEGEVAPPGGGSDEQTVLPLGG